MKFSVNLLGREVSFDGPDTAEEFDALTQPGQCLKLAMRDIMYRPVGSPYRAAVVKWLEENTGIKPKEVKTKEVKKKGKTETVSVYETEEVYFDRLKALKATAGELSFEATFEAAHEAGLKAVGPLNEVVKKAGQGRSDVAEQWIKRAEATMGKWESGDQTQEDFEENVRNVLGDDWEGLGENPSVTDVAKVIKKFVESI